MNSSIPARLLAIDTTSDSGSIAIAENGAIVEEVVLHSSDGFGHILFPQIEQLLDRHGWSVESLGAFAAASGPGSFTGVRVGLTAVKGLADATGKPVIAVSNLRAIASFGTAAMRAAIADARRDEIYGGVYDASGQLVQDEVVMKLPDWLAQLPAGAVEFVSQNAGRFASAVPGPHLEAPRALAAAIARIATAELAAGRARDPIAINANYVRRTDAELFWKDV